MVLVLPLTVTLAVPAPLVRASMASCTPETTVPLPLTVTLPPLPLA